MRLLETDAAELDAELLDIYLTEAGEVVDTVATSSAALKKNNDDREALRIVRRGFHTLKGSGRMVGLTDLGELAFEVEKVFNRVLEEDLPVTPSVLELVDVAQTAFRVWVDTLRRRKRVTPDAKALRAAIGKVYAELPNGPEPPPSGSPTPTTRQAPTASSAQSSALSTTPSAPSAPSHTAPVSGQATPLLGDEDFMAMFEADLEADRGDEALTAGAPSDALPMIEILEQDDTGSASNDAEAGAGDAEVIEFAARATPAEVATPPEVAALESDETTVGDVTLSTALYRILCDEAQQHLATLDTELQTLQFDTSATPSQAMVRAGHTLCGIHRTGGFPLVASTAKVLEQCLLALQERGAPLPSAALPVLARAIAALRMLVGRVGNREAFNALG